ncbi:MAG: polyprenyl synthetase family protein [Methanomassiliicoccales archaeon]
MGFEEVLDDKGEFIELELKRYFSCAVEEGYRYDPIIGEFYEGLQEFTLREGKRLAAVSTLISYEGYSGEIDDRILRVACGIEIFRHSILVHDDLVDEDDMRRGCPTLHRGLEIKYDERFGRGSAVFLGNMMFNLALRPILNSGFSPAKTARAVDLITAGYREVNESQILDLLFEYRSPTVEQWETMAARRAASLFRTTMLAGAVLGGASRGDLEPLEDAATHIGYAFDIQDDIIDTFASKDQYGREPCGDVLKGKKPLHIILAVQREPDFARLIGDPGADVEEIRDRMVESGALSQAKQMSMDHADRALEALDRTEMAQGSRDFFESFLEFIKNSLEWYK